MRIIKGITVYKHIYMGRQSTYYFGYNENNEIVKTCDPLSMMLEPEFQIDLNKEYNEFIAKLVNDINIFSWKNEHMNYATNDGEEWRITIHYKSGRTRNFFGMNAYPLNYNEFVKLCNLYNFANYNEEDEYIN